MNIRTFAAALAALVAAFCGHATDYYVDAVNGNDDWNGLVDFASANPAEKVGPKKTLAVFTSLVRNSDTIYVAPGWYTNGVSASDSNFRFYTSAGNISLIATGSAEDTFIGGEPDTSVSQNSSPWGCGAGAVVPIKMLGGNNLVKGITIFGGRQKNYTGAYGGGAVFAANANTDCMIDCVITNCIAPRGGGTHNLGMAIRCRFTGNYATEGSHAQNLNCAVNCIFENTDRYAVYNNSSGGTFLNCLCRGNKVGNFRTNGGPIYVYNSVFLHGGGTETRNKNCSFFDCFFDYNPFGQVEEITGTNGECRVFSTGSLRFNVDGSPMKGNPVVDAANSAYYDSNFPVALDVSEKPLDIFKHVRTFGNAMDIGPIERNDATADDNEWFVDDVNGSDSNSGKTLAQAFKTLARASTNALMVAGDIVYVAEGVYNSGVVPASVGGVDETDNRMAVLMNVDFVAMGRREETIVEGASSSATASGIGAGAVRCCLMKGGSIRGFTLRYGNVNANASSANGDQGGGIRFKSSDAHAYDCEIHSCNAVRGGGVASGTSAGERGVLLRCYVHDNTNNGEGVTPTRSTAGTDAYYCSGYNSVVKGDCYLGTMWLNCTLPGKCWGAGTTFANCYIGEDGAAAQSVAATFTNCVCAGEFKSFTSHSGCKENASCVFDANWRPKRHSSAVVNAGDVTLYTSLFPAALSDFRDFDYAGGERMLEDHIDVGAGEMIWTQTGMIINFR